jgi:predicted RNase H-like HicB family nuclease
MPEIRGIDRHAITIHWCAEDDAFDCIVPELPGCTAHGATREEALANAQGAISAWIATAEEFGDPFPRPAESGC